LQSKATDWTVCPHGTSGTTPGKRQTLCKEIRPWADEAEKRGQLIRHLEEALALGDEMEDGQTGFLIERAIDEARSCQFRPMG
jgi:hypothetical protein